MRKILATLILALPLLAADPKPKVKITTNMGAFTIQLEPDAVPKTVENFLKYVRKGFYNGTIFHRIKANFMIQGGGYLPNLSEKPSESSINNEADLAKAKGLLNKRGTVAMAVPMGNPLGATTQFFVNVKDNPNLDFKEKTMTGYGYCVFGKVIQGMDVVDKIKLVKTQKKGEHDNFPVKPVIIEKAEEVR